MRARVRAHAHLCALHMKTPVHLLFLQPPSIVSTPASSATWWHRWTLALSARKRQKSFWLDPTTSMLSLMYHGMWCKIIWIGSNHKYAKSDVSWKVDVKSFGMDPTTSMLSLMYHGMWCKIVLIGSNHKYANLMYHGMWCKIILIGSNQKYAKSDVSWNVM